MPRGSHPMTSSRGAGRVGTLPIAQAPPPPRHTQKHSLPVYYGAAGRALSVSTFACISWRGS